MYWSMKSVDVKQSTKKCFPFAVPRRDLNTQQSPLILDLCLRKSRAGKSHHYRDAIALEKISFYYIDTDVLLKNIPLVKFIKNTSGTRVVYFP